MRAMWKVFMLTVLLVLIALPTVALVPPDQPPSALDSRLPVAMAQPLAASDGAPLVQVATPKGSAPMLPESGVLIVIGSALFGLAALVRRAT